MKKRFNINSYDYFLPELLIAQEPIKKRDDSKLLILDKITGNIEHKKFKNIVDYLNKSDVLVLNNTKVIPSRIYGIKNGTGAKIEVFLLKEKGNNVWQTLTSPQKRLKENTIIKFSNDLSGQVIKLYKDGITDIKFIYKKVFIELLEKIGAMPLPPYIHKKLKNKNRYQTVYAKYLGSAAAPTAGLHFTESLLNELNKKGVEILYITLHVGLGTFRPVNENDIRQHYMHSEYYEINEYTAKRLNEAKKNGKRIISVGTTSLRTLESNIQKYNEFKSTKEETNIFIYPGYHFKAIDSLITNFHLPKSTLIMLISALAGRKKVLNAYNEAVENKYRFFSFGDAMFINNTNYKNKYHNILKNYNKHNFLTKDNFKIDKGNNNIILSAPHANEHKRNNKILAKENNTANIVKIIGMITNSHIIYTYKDDITDHNYDETSYKKELSKYIKNNNISYLIDIHGININTKCALEIGTSEYKLISEDLSNKIKEIFSKFYKEEIIIDKKFKAKNNKRISNYINELNKINTIQLEINKKYRSLEHKSLSFNKTIKSLIEVISLLNEED